jgi:hypothetical protein
MPAADFQARIAKHREKAHARPEAHIAKKNLPADKAAAVRAKMAAAEAVVKQEVARVVARECERQDEGEGPPCVDVEFRNWNAECLDAKLLECGEQAPQPESERERQEPARG